MSYFSEGERYKPEPKPNKSEVELYKYNHKRIDVVQATLKIGRTKITQIKPYYCNKQRNPVCKPVKFKPIKPRNTWQRRIQKHLLSVK